VAVHSGSAAGSSWGSSGGPGGATSTASISKLRSNSTRAEEDESDEQKMCRLVKAHLDKSKVMEKELPNFAPQPVCYTMHFAGKLFY